MNREQKILVALACALFLACNAVACLSGLIVGGTWAAAVARLRARAVQPVEPALPSRPPLQPEVPRQLQPMRFAALVTEVTEGSPAAGAGLQAGDLILAVDGTGIERDADLKAMLAAYRPGDRIALTVRRGDREKEVRVKLGEHPQDPRQPYLGLAYRVVSVGR